ncbi:alkaline phosphatase family protein [Hydrogenobacter hydrogenophilus]|uniref:Type I phosphodiesterase / nucleotide pyrophosphatase n=1 Tax=Hydrogenobacter hydrogenophilus TaxID=35835 RepID=A0A285NZ33_9AQUI|nr:alkaline phosphatase family protein [Hydrogenobacter hydrogenophilus]SNZ14742.1 Type I phosphodiesterase / nucleotide pyrophosphatase [Hydrogenobacter hydrogenophilus]
MRKGFLFFLTVFFLVFAVSCGGGGGTSYEGQKRNVIIFVWDGLRPDSINPTDLPNLYKLAQEGVFFEDNHSTYPTFTMINASSFATGSFPDKVGFYGNTVWAPGAKGNNSAGQPVDYNQPVFTEDYAILDTLNAYYNNQLLMVATLFQKAQEAGLKTAVIGKSGSAYIQDYKRGGIILDEKMVYPLDLAKELQQAGYPLPKTTPIAYPQGSITLSTNNGDPTAFKPRKNLSDGITSDPTDTSGSPYCDANTYMMKVYLDYILPKKKPNLTLIWFRDPDSTEHAYGVGNPNYRSAMRCMDNLLGMLLNKLKELGIDNNTDIIIVSDHGHSNVSGPLNLFPLRSIGNAQVGAPDPNGYSVSGDVRLADLLTRAGFKAYDGNGCSYDPVMSGIKADGTTVYQTQVDPDGSVCGKPGQKYTTPSYKVPQNLPPDAIVIASNGGSEYIYVPSRNPDLVRKVVLFLQSREEFGAIFVDDRYGKIPGTLPMSMVRLENTAKRNPDIIVSYDYDENAVIQGFRGIEFESMFNLRGMHGSFSPIDVRNTLIAYGPDFKKGFRDKLPTGNVDVAPTVARILGISLLDADGRPLVEALVNSNEAVSGPTIDYIYSDKVSGIQMKLPTDPDGKDIDNAKSSFYVKLQIKKVVYNGRTYTYFDFAKGVRE